MANPKLAPLVIKAQAGDPDALNDLMGECYQTLFYYAYNTVKNEDLAADLTQESCIEIMQTLKNLRNPIAFLTWASRIVAHQCTRYYRQTQDETSLDENEDGATIMDRLPDESRGSLPEQVQEDKEFKEIMWQMLDSLPEEQRQALLLYYVDDMSVGEIAEIQGKSVGTIKSRLYYGRNTVINQVNEYEKKHDIKLHSLVPLPLLLYFLFRDNMAQVLENSADTLQKLRTGISAAATATAGAATATAGAATATAGAAITGGTAGGAAAALGTGIVTKIIAGIAAAVVAVGAVIGGIAIANHNDRPGISDEEYEAVEMLAGQWYASDAMHQPEQGFVLTDDGILTYHGETHYLCCVIKDYYVVDQNGNKYTQKGYILYFSQQESNHNYGKVKDMSLHFLFRYVPQREEVPGIFPYEARLFISRGNNEFYGGGTFDRLVEINHPETPEDTQEVNHGTIEDWRIHFGSWQSVFYPEQNFLFQEDGTLQINGQTYLWTLENCALWDNGGSITITDAQNNTLHTLMFDLMPDGHYQCMVLGPENYISPAEDRYFYRPSDYEGYTVVPLTVDNVLDYIVQEKQCGFNPSANTDGSYFFYGDTFSFRDNLIGFCKADFLHFYQMREVTVDIENETYTLGPVVGYGVHEDSEATTGIDDAPYYTVLTPCYNELYVTASTDHSKTIQVDDGYIFDAWSVQGFVLLPPDYDKEIPHVEKDFSLDMIFGTWQKMSNLWSSVSETLTVNRDGTIVLGDKTMRWTQFRNTITTNNYWGLSFELDPETMDGFVMEGNQMTFIYHPDGTFLLEFCQAKEDGDGSYAYIYQRPEYYTQISVSPENVMNYVVIEDTALLDDYDPDHPGPDYGQIGTTFLLKDDLGAISNVIITLEVRRITYQVTIDGEKVTRTKLRDNGTEVIDINIDANYFASETFLGEQLDFTGEGPYTLEVDYFEILSVQAVTGALYYPK